MGHEILLNGSEHSCVIQHGLELYVFFLRHHPKGLYVIATAKSSLRHPPRSFRSAASATSNYVSVLLTIFVAILVVSPPTSSDERKGRGFGIKKKYLPGLLFYFRPLTSAYFPWLAMVWEYYITARCHHYFYFFNMF